MNNHLFFAVNDIYFIENKYMLQCFLHKTREIIQKFQGTYSTNVLKLNKYFL